MSTNNGRPRWRWRFPGLGSLIGLFLLGAALDPIKDGADIAALTVITVVVWLLLGLESR